MSLMAQSARVAKTLTIGISLMLVVALAGCFTTREKDAEDAEAAAARSQASAERAEEAANKALEASAAAMKAADHAAAAVKEATKEMDRVSAHLEQLQREREAEDAEDAPPKPRHRKPVVSPPTIGVGDATDGANWGPAASPAAQPSPAK